MPGSEAYADLIAAVHKYPALRNATTFSIKTLAEVRHELAQELSAAKANSPIISVSGSVARLEASGQSDIDFMAIFPRSYKGDREAFVAKVRRILWRSAAERTTALARPNPNGVFGAAVEEEALVDKIGSREEDYNNIARRLLLLLESKALWNEKAFDSLRTTLIAAYTQDLSGDGTKHLVLLINDLIRYFRSICVNYHNVKTTDGVSWPLRNVKLRHSRVLMYTSLLFCLGELSKYEHRHPADTDTRRRNKSGLLQDYVRMTPLQRFLSLYETNGDDNSFRFLSLYNNFLAALSDPVKRQELTNLTYDDRYESPTFASLKANSDAFASEVLRFLFARRGIWSDRFFEYLIV